MPPRAPAGPPTTRHGVPVPPRRRRTTPPPHAPPRSRSPRPPPPTRPLAPPISEGPPFAEVLHGLAGAIRALEKPVIAAVQGYAYGAGLSLALACDIRIVAPDAQLCEAYIRIGRYSGGGDTVMLPRAVGTGRALRMLWSGDAISR